MLAKYISTQQRKYSNSNFRLFVVVVRRALSTKFVPRLLDEVYRAVTGVSEDIQVILLQRAINILNLWL